MSVLTPSLQPQWLVYALRAINGGDFSATGVLDPMIAKKKDLDQIEAYAGWSDEGGQSKSPQRRPAVARGDESPVHSPAHQLQSRVLAQYGEPEVEKWPGLGRVAILGVGAVAAWALIGVAVVLVTR